MPSDNKKGPTSGPNNVKEISHKKKKVSLGWIFGMAILILIAISFVAAPAIEAIVGGSNSNEIKFGSYDGKDISYSQDSYFYDQYQYYGTQYKGTTSDSNLALYQIWSQAFNSTVLFTAISQMANKIGYTDTETSINNAIISSGYYNVDNNFDVATYNKTSSEQKASIRKKVVRQLPYQTVLNDVQSVLTSDAETDYVSKMADNSKTFKYVVFDQSTYPKEDAAKYALANPTLFNMIDISIISTTDEAAAKTALTDINNGKSFDEEAIAVSKDSYASKGGAIGSTPYYAIKVNFKNADDSLKVLEANNGDVVGPYETDNGYAIYKINKAAITPDYTNETTISMIRSYITNYDADIMTVYLTAKANSFISTIADDFDAAATAENLSVNNVSSTSENIGNSQYLSSFTTNDTKGVLATAATKEETMKALFDAKVGTTVAPISSNGSVIVAYVASEDTASGMGQYIKSVYPQYSGTHNAQDLESAIMASDKLQNNFLTVFLDKIMSKTTSAK
ncbi:MAG: peptidylprolyl isomerase [Spirochaetaceae bacterium]|nr:peptidylprolyl isomerase [Spirochaetaceae bacterium]